MIEGQNMRGTGKLMKHHKTVNKLPWEEARSCNPFSAQTEVTLKLLLEGSIQPLKMHY